jgi:hypothetical protein
MNFVLTFGLGCGLSTGKLRTQRCGEKIVWKRANVRSLKVGRRRMDLIANASIWLPNIYICTTEKRKFGRGD